MDEQIITLLITGCISILMLLLLLYSIFQNALISELKVQYYVVAVGMTILAIATQDTAVLFEHLDQKFRIANEISHVISISIVGFIPLIFVQMIDVRLKKYIVLLYIPPVINTFLAIVSLKTGWIFSISEQNIYRKGPLYLEIMVVYLYGILLLVIVNHINTSHYQKKERIFYLMMYSVMVIGIIFQLLFPFTHTTSQVLAVLILIFYLFRRELQYKYDALTNLFNRQEFDRMIRRASMENHVAIILFDVDKFKTINDTYGHITGDVCLRRSAELIKEVFQKVGFSYRIGGDEFCVIAKDITELDLELLLKKLEAKIEYEKEIGNITTTISFGYSFYKKETHQNIIEAVNEADARMYQLKQGVKESLT